MNRGFGLKFSSLAYRFLLWFVIAALLPLGLFGYLSLQNHEAELRSETLNRMGRLADKKTLEIKNFLAERRQDAQLLARGNLVEAAMRDLSRAYTYAGVDSTEYRQAAKPFDKNFSAHIGKSEDTLYYDIFLITPQGEIIYTYKHEADFATNLISGPYRDSQLAQVFRESRTSLESSLSDFEYYAPSSESAAFVSAPIVRDGRLFGVVAFQLDTRHIYRVAQDNSGLGKSGEIALAKLTGVNEAMFVAPLRHDPQAALQRKLDLATTGAPMRYALAGQRGAGIEIDYSGRTVVAAWRYLPELRWGVVVKMDAAEAFAPIYQKHKYLLEILLSLAVLGGFLAFYFGRNMVFRLREFADNADEIAQGDLGKRVDESGTDEISALARSFNHMTVNLQALYRTLEERVEERTGELNATNARLQKEIFDRRKAEEQLRIAAATFETHEAILITDANANIIRVNQAFTDITGYSQEEVLGKNPNILSSGRQDIIFYAEMWRQLLGAGTWSGEIWDRRKNGQIYPKQMTITAVKDEQGETTEYVAIFSDITARKQAEEEIRNLAFYDALTKLPNRRLLLDRFSSALTVSARSHHYGAVLFIDMDRFKTLNDTLGHNYGDLLLIEVAKRIHSCIREVDTVARLGGDEFVVLLEEIGKDAEEASQKIALVADKIRVSLTAPYQLKNHEYLSSPSIGVCLYRGNEESVDALLKHADMAMYQVKATGRNAVRFFDPALQKVVEAHAAMDMDLRHAVPDHQLRLYYQIQLDNEGRPLGAEVLVRWMHPVKGMIQPMEFIHIAEESSLILDVGQWVMETACRQLALWGQREKTRDLVIAVNVSAHEFRLPDFVDRVAALVRTHQVNPSRLKLELTESVVLEDVTNIAAKMHTLKAMGIQLSLDDFGTGYSSLSYLKKLPLEQIKIDQSFVRDITLDANDDVMVKSIIDMAKNFHLNIIAEGVETEAQLAFLKENGCMAYQGFLFGKPMPIEEFEALLDEV